jgi:ABC-type sulfate/molybdate transport systems ATPase subunit
VLEEVRRRAGVTVLHITHNRREAARLADVVLRLENGRVLPQAIDAP